MATLQDLRDKTYRIINETQDSPNFPLAEIDDLLNKNQQVILNSNPYFQERDNQIQKPKFPFLDSDTFFSSTADTFLTAVATIGSTTLDATTTNFPTSGAIWLDGNIITYTGVTGTQFTGIPATGENSIQFADIGGTRVSLLYDVPTDMSQVQEFVYSSQYAMLFKNYDNLYKQLRELPHYLRRDVDINNNTNGFFRNVGPMYTIIKAQYILMVNINVSDRKLHLRYQSEPTTMVSSTDVSIIPDKFATSVLPYFAARDMLYDRDQKGEAQLIARQAIGKLKEMYDFYAEQQKETYEYNRVGTGKDMALNI